MSEDTAGPAGTAGTDAPEPDAATAIRFVTRGLDTAELAAATAVLRAALAEESAAAIAEHGAVAQASGWERARRNLRQPLVRPWRNFTG